MNALSANPVPLILKDSFGDIVRKWLASYAEAMKHKSPQKTIEQLRLKVTGAVVAPYHKEISKYQKTILLNAPVTFLMALQNILSIPYYNTEFPAFATLHQLWLNEYYDLYTPILDKAFNSVASKGYLSLTKEDVAKWDKKGVTKKEGCTEEMCRKHLNGIWSVSLIRHKLVAVWRWQYFLIKFANKALSVDCATAKEALEAFRGYPEVQKRLALDDKYLNSQFLGIAHSITNSKTKLDDNVNALIASRPMQDILKSIGGFEKVAEEREATTEGVEPKTNEGFKYDFNYVEDDVFEFLKEKWGDFMDNDVEFTRIVDTDHILERFPSLIVIDPPYFMNVADWDRME